jgi:hypothetical protein
MIISYYNKCFYFSPDAMMMTYRKDRWAVHAEARARIGKIRKPFYFNNIKITAHSDDKNHIYDNIKMDLKRQNIYAVKGLTLHTNFGSLRIR